MRLVLPADVKPYVKRGKTDAVDAETFFEADTRQTIRFAPVKSADRQAALVGHKARDFLARQKMQIVSVIRTHLDEFGAVMAKGIHHVDRLFDAARDVPLWRAWPFHILSSQLRDT